MTTYTRIRKIHMKYKWVCYEIFIWNNHLYCEVFILSIYCKIKKRKKMGIRQLPWFTGFGDHNITTFLSPSGILVILWPEIFGLFVSKIVNIMNMSLVSIQSLKCLHMYSSCIVLIFFPPQPETAVIKGWGGGQFKCKYHCFSWGRNKYINNFLNDNSFHPHKHIASRTKNGHESKSLMYNPSNRKSTSKSYFIHPRLICSCLLHYSQAPQVLVLGSMCW